MTATALTVAEAAALLRVSKVTVYRMIETGRLPHFRVGRAVRLSHESLTAWMSSQTIKSPSA